MKKLLLALVFFGALVCLYWYLTKPRTTPVYLSPSDQISKQEKPHQAHEIYEIVKNINEKNAKIQSIYISEMPIRLQHGKITAKVNGELAMQREKNFRLKIAHRVTGKEMDIGSNSSVFWFWSKRMSPPSLHYAKHEDLGKTNLRTALNPNWMMESLGVLPISMEDVEIAKFKNYWAVIQPRKSANGESVNVLTLINPEGKVVIGRYLYGSNGKLVASTEYQNFSGTIAKKILIIWYEEDIILDWDLSQAKINTGISPEYWKMPDMKNSIDISK